MPSTRASLCCILLLAPSAPAAEHKPLALHPANPHYFLFRGKPAEAAVAPNPNFTVSVVADAGHSPHRDQPEATIQALFAALA